MGSLNPEMEQDFRDMARAFNKMSLLARRGVVRAMLGQKEGVAETLREMKAAATELPGIIDTLSRGMDTFTDRLEEAASS